jgi:hypothetical protein
MTLLNLRQAIVNIILDNELPGVRHFYDDTRKVDSRNLNQFIRVSIELDDDEQVDLGSNHMIRTYGEVQFQIMLREGQTNSVALQAMEHYRNLLTNTIQGEVNFETFTRGNPKPVGDWYLLTTEVRFNALTVRQR